VAVMGVVVGGGGGRGLLARLRVVTCRWLDSIGRVIATAKIFISPTIVLDAIINSFLFHLPRLV
jgi:hypothetical protein